MLENNVSLVPDFSECDNASVIHTDFIVYTDNKYSLTAIAVCLSVLAAFTVFANVFVIVAVCYSHLREHLSNAGGSGYTKSNLKLLMASMAVGDALIGGLVMPVYISGVIHNGRWAFPKGSCKYIGMLDVVLCTTSIYHLMFMAVDRYLAICRPLTHRSLTVKSGFAMAGLCWVVPVVIYIVVILFNVMSEHTAPGSCGQLFDLCQFNTSLMVSFGVSIPTILLPFFFTCFLYVFILCEVKRFHKRKSKRQEFQSGTRSTVSDEHNLPISTVHHSDIDDCLKIDKINTTSGCSTANVLQNATTSIKSETCPTSLADTNTRSTNNTIMADNVNKKITLASTTKNVGKNSAHKAFLTTGLLVFCFAVCWCPFPLVLCIKGIGKKSDFPNWSVRVVSWIGLFNSTLNPLLICSHRGMRRSMKRLLQPRKTVKILKRL